MRDTVERPIPRADAMPPGASIPLPAGLVYVTADMPGLTRVKRGDRFRYRRPDGRWLSDPEDEGRIRRLAIPPAYTQVWICPLPHGHLQATGLDARGRRQYRYHAEWRRVRDEDKFARMVAFGQALPRIRARVARDLVPRRGQPPLARTLVLATIVRLLDTTYLRVGNEAYASENGSYGLTTLRRRHAGVRGSTLRLKFRGKSGVEQQASLEDARVARVVRRCQQLPGQELFQYVDEDGIPHAIDSGDVNDYLHEIAGGESRFTAKDFRTWHGTVQALELTRLACTAAPDASEGVARNAREILIAVAKQLGNTPAVCKKSYVHPAVLALGARIGGDPGPDMQKIWARIGGTQKPRVLSAAERRLLGFLRHAPALKEKVARQAGGATRTTATRATSTKAGHAT